MVLALRSLHVHSAQDVQKEEDAAWALLARRNRAKYSIVALAFVLCTGFQVFTGIKCVSYSFHNEWVEGLLMVRASLQLLCLRSLLSLVTNCGYVVSRCKRYITRGNFSFVTTTELDCSNYREMLSMMSVCLMRWWLW
jgi:hypothetical protein